jgi:hypothetical protein
MLYLNINLCTAMVIEFIDIVFSYNEVIRDLTILGRQRDGDGQNKLLQINGSKDSSSYIINRMNLIQF